MTTIAWDGDNLASDSQATRDFAGTGHCEHCDGRLRYIVTHYSKILAPSFKEEIFFKEQRVLAVAGAGDAGMAGLYRNGLLNGVALKVIHHMAYETHKNKSRCPTAVLLVVTTESVWEVEHTSPQAKVKEVTQVPYAIGSGAPAALLAMKRLGLTAMAAVACAIDVDKYSGGAVNYLSCRGDAGAKIEAYTYTPEDIAELFQ